MNNCDVCKVNYNFCLFFIDANSIAYYKLTQDVGIEIF